MKPLVVLIAALGCASCRTVEAPPAADCLDNVQDYAGWRAQPGQSWDYAWPSREAPRLTIIGASHERSPDHPQFARIAAAFAQARPTIAFFEGPDRGVGADSADTIRTRGESGYLRFLAAGAGIPAHSLEPAPPEQIRNLTRDFPIDQVMLFFVLREATRLRDREGLSGEALDRAVAALLQRVQQLGPQVGIPLPFTDVAGLEAAAARYWPQRDWRAADSRWFDPLADDADTGGVFAAAVNRADSNQRNRHMAELLIAAVRRGERPFVLVGGNHVPMIAPALACALEEPPAR